MDNPHALSKADALDAAAADFLENIAPELFDLISDCDPVSHRSLTILNWIDDLQDDRTEALKPEGLAQVLRSAESLIDARLREASSAVGTSKVALLDRNVRPDRDASGAMLALAALAHLCLITKLAQPKLATKIIGGARYFHREELERIAAISADAGA